MANDEKIELLADPAGQPVDPPGVPQENAVLFQELINRAKAMGVTPGSRLLLADGSSYVLPENPTPPPKTRPAWEDTFFQIAWTWAARATCPRRSVGCVIVDPQHAVLASGYNGAPRGMPHCADVGCTLEGNHCVSAVHAEMNAIAFAARQGVSLQGGEAYCTLLPCIQCMQALSSAGVKIIHYDETYLRSERNHLYRLALAGGIQLVERKRS